MLAYNERKMLEDVNGDLIPQYYDANSDTFKPLLDERAELENIKQTQEQILDRLNQPLDTQSFGKNESIEVFPREVRQAGVYNSSEIRKPDGATKLYVIFRARGITGSGVSINFRSVLNTDVGIDLIWLRNDQLTSTTRVIHGWGVGDLQEAETLDDERVLKLTGLSPAKTMRAVIQISGDFDEGEGVDTEAEFIWVS